MEREHAKHRWQKVDVACRDLVMWGAADQCRVNYPILMSLGCRFDALIDDTQDRTSPIENVPIYYGEQGLDQFLRMSPLKRRGFVVAIGNPYGSARVRLHRVLRDHGLIPVSFADGTSSICHTANFGDGLQVMPHAVVHSYVRIGVQCLINTRALVEHDCVLGDGVEIGPGAVLCGRVNIGDNSWVAANATVRPRVTIGSNTIIGAGAVVVNNIPSNVLAVGVPAKVVRENRIAP
jgi:sugar O-acyltransferase (sialic acid O-acetyltransferase NeuD family)